MQRLRIAFGRGEGARYLSHLEMMRMWERAFRRAGWRLAYSQGFRPHPKISFAAALPVGVAGREELLEVHLEQPRPPADAPRELARQLPQGFEVRAVEEVPLGEPPLQRLLVAAEYEAVCPKGPSAAELREGVERLLSATSLPRERIKEGEAKAYDLRPMIRRLAVEGSSDGNPMLRMELRTDARGAGRPDEVLRALGVDPADCRITRTRLLLQ